MKNIRKILFATDFSPASTKAFDQAVETAAETGAELLVAHAYEPPTRPVADAMLVPQVFDDYEDAIRAEAEKTLKSLVAAAAGAGVDAKPLVLKGPADQAITVAAWANRVDLIVLGTHGRTGMKRLLLGSVAARVISTSRCPVLTVRAA